MSLDVCERRHRTYPEVARVALKRTEQPIATRVAAGNALLAMLDLRGTPPALRRLLLPRKQSKPLLPPLRYENDPHFSQLVANAAAMRYAIVIR